MEFINAVVWFVTVVAAFMVVMRSWGLWDMTPIQIEMHGAEQAGNILKWGCVLVISILWHIFGG